MNQDERIPAEIEQLLRKAANMAQLPIYQKEERGTNRFRVLVYNSMLLFHRFPKVQEEGLRFYRFMSAYNQPYVDSAAGLFYIDLIVETLRVYKKNLNVQLHGIASLVNICRQSRDVAVTMLDMDHGVQVLVDATREYSREHHNENGSGHAIYTKAVFLIRYLKSMDYDGTALDSIDEFDEQYYA